MPQPITVKCGKCGQLLKAVPLPQDFQLTCPKCATTLRIRGQNNPPPAQPLQPTRPSVSPTNPPVRPQRAAAPVGFPAVGSSPQPTPYHPATARRPNVTQGARQGTRPAAKNQKTLWIVAAVGGVLSLAAIGLIAAYVLTRGPSNAAMAAGDATNQPVASDLASGPNAGSTDSGAGAGSAAGVLPTGRKFRPTSPAAASFPALGEPELTYPSGARRYFVEFGSPGRQPASQMQFRVFIPPGEHALDSLPCVLIAPAGTNLMHGVSLTRGTDYDAEAMPYVEAGMVVVQYSLDGPLPPGMEPSNPQAMNALIQAYAPFATSGAGAANAKRAMDFALEKLDVIDPQKVFCAGHSSAGNVALLAGADDIRLAGVIAYAAAYDLRKRMQDLTADPQADRMFPNFLLFVLMNSPLEKVSQIRCPVFVFHARDDSNVPYADAEAFVAKCKSASIQVTFENTPSGEHYQSMIREGIPTAIRWIAKQPGKEFGKRR